jgi:hypothetical protein
MRPVAFFFAIVGSALFGAAVLCLERPANANVPTLNARVVPDGRQPIASHELTRLPWAAVSERFPAELTILDPEHPERVWLRRPGLYLITFVVTFGSSGSGIRKAHLMQCTLDIGGAERCHNAFDGGEIPATAPSREATVNGAGFVRSDGAAYLVLIALQTSGHPLTFSEREYEQHLHLHWVNP